MPAPDLAAIMESLQPLIFSPAEEAAVDPNRLLLVAPDDSDWTLAYRSEDGWFSNDGMRIEAPLVYAQDPREVAAAARRAPP
jgi:hypothetical protein